MNSDMIDAAVTKIVASLLAGYTGDAIASGSEKQAIAAGIGALAAVLYGVYRHWNMRKVPATSVVTALAPTVTAAKAASISAAK
jgi:hypothetical protein